MKVFVTVILTMAGLAAGVVDEDLNVKYMTMQRSNFIDYFNEKNYSWKMKQYSNIFFNINFHVVIDPAMSNLPIKYNYHIPHLPVNFDSRDKWCKCESIKKIYNQHHCGSCWAHGVANTASDRTCIHTNEQVELSEQDLECSHFHQTICHGGLPTEGFKFWKDRGIVTRKCKPYDPLDVNRNTCERMCKHNETLSLKGYFDDKHFASEVYSVPNNSIQIKTELYLNGPIQAIMPVYKDFQDPDGVFGYASGIYEHKLNSTPIYHSVRVIGYGVEHGTEYWLVANSWGRDWGENGLFRIKSFQKDMRFEELLMTGIPINNKTPVPTGC